MSPPASQPTRVHPFAFSILPHRNASHLDAMGVVSQPVEDAVGRSGISYPSRTLVKNTRT
jgi:hypothetical protein